MTARIDPEVRRLLRFATTQIEHRLSGDVARWFADVGALLGDGDVPRSAEAKPRWACSHNPRCPSELSCKTNNAREAQNEERWRCRESPRSDTDWTASNSSPLYLKLVESIADHLGNIRVGDALEAHARCILSRLAHIHGLAPKDSGTEPAEGGKRLDNRDPSSVHVGPLGGGAVPLADRSPASASFGIGDHPLKGACAPSLDPNVTFCETVTSAAPNAGPAHACTCGTAMYVGTSRGRYAVDQARWTLWCCPKCHAHDFVDVEPVASPVALSVADVQRIINARDDIDAVGRACAAIRRETIEACAKVVSDYVPDTDRPYAICHALHDRLQALLRTGVER